MGTCMRQFYLGEAVLTCTYNLCFEQKYKTYQIFPMKFSFFTATEKSLDIAWTSFRNVKFRPA